MDPVMNRHQVAPGTQVRDFPIANLNVEVIANGVGENHASIGQNHRVSAYAIRLLGGIAFRAERGHAFA